MTEDKTNDLGAIIKTVRGLLLEDALSGEDPASLEDTTPLITGGLLDSIGTVKLVAQLEDAFGIRFEAFEISVEYMDSVAAIAKTVFEKKESK